MKKLLSSLVLISILLTACFVGAMPASAAEVNYDDFDIYDGILVEYVGKEGGDIVIPSVDEDGEPVTEIDARAFMDNESITSVVIPEGITKIGAEAFQGCTYLEKVSLPFSLEEGGYSIFRNCKSLQSIVIPATLKNVPQDFCSGCTSLTDVTISYGIETIGVLAFCGVPADRIVFPETVSEIYGIAMSNCTQDRCEIIICNPNCDLGYMNGYSGRKDYAFPFGSPEHKKTAWTFKAQENSTVAGYIEQNMPAEGRIITMTKEAIADLEENQKTWGLVEAPKVEEKDDKTTGEEGTENNNGTDTAGTATDMGQILLIVGIAFGALIIIIIAVVVIVVVVNNNKKKKKAAAKAARRAAKKAAAAKAEEAVEEVAEDAVEDVADDAE